MMKILNDFIIADRSIKGADAKQLRRLEKIGIRRAEADYVNLDSFIDENVKVDVVKVYKQDINIENIFSYLRKVIDKMKETHVSVMRYLTEVLDNGKVCESKYVIFVEQLKRTGEYAKERGVKIAVEPAKPLQPINIYNLLKILEDVNCDAVGMSFNPWKFIYNTTTKNIDKDYFVGGTTDLQIMGYGQRINLLPFGGLIREKTYCIYIENYRKTKSDYFISDSLYGCMDILEIIAFAFGWAAYMKEEKEYIIVESPVIRQYLNTGKINELLVENVDYYRCIDNATKYWSLKMLKNGGGKGEAYFEPSRVVSGEISTWKLIFKAGEGGIKLGGGLKIQMRVFSHARVEPQFRFPEELEYIDTLTDVKGVKLKLTTEPFPIIITIKIIKGELREGEEVEIIFGDISKGSPGATAELIPHKYVHQVGVDAEGTGNYQRIETAPVLDVIPDDIPARLALIMPSTVNKEEKFTGNLFAENKDHYPILESCINKFQGILELTTSHEALQKKKIEIDERNSGLATPEFKLNKSGIFRMSVKDNQRGIYGIGNPVKCIDENQEYRIYWGELHQHTTVSDGIESLEGNLLFGRDVSRLDFAALADHYQSVTEKDWEEYKELLEKLYEPDKFTTLLGLEVGLINDLYKDINIYFKDINQPYFTFKTLEEVYEYVERGKGMVISHAHNNKVDWNLAHPHLQRLIEITSCHINIEHSGAPVSFPSQENCYINNMIESGLKFGIMGAADSHGGFMGRAPYDSWRYSPITAVYAKSLTREDIWEGLWNKRCYATTNARIILDFKMDGHYMGEEYASCWPCEIMVEVVGTTGIYKVDIIKNNNICHYVMPDSDYCRFSYCDNRKSDGFNCYYIRVQQIDGEFAWSSPIWVNIQ